MLLNLMEDDHLDNAAAARGNFGRARKSPLSEDGICRHLGLLDL